MIYSIGYQGKSLEELIVQLKGHGVNELIDVRSRPFGRRPEFNRKRITGPLTQQGIEYTWVGKYLGGFASILETEIKNLAEHQQSKNVCLMCMEADHSQCHRDYEIGTRLRKYSVEILHL